MAWKKFDFARKNLDGRAKCLAQKNEKKPSKLKNFSLGRPIQGTGL